MRVLDILKRSGRSLKQAKARTILTAAAIGVGAFALTLTLAASNGATSFVDKIIGDNFNPAELIVVKDKSVLGNADNSKPREYDPSFGQATTNVGTRQVQRLTDVDIKRIRNQPTISEVREGVILNLQYLSRPAEGTQIFKKLVATADMFSNAQHPNVVAGTITRPLISGTMILPDAYVQPLGFGSANEAVGKPVTVAVLDTNGSVTRNFTIAAVVKKQTTVQPGTELYLYLGTQDILMLNDITTQNTDNYHKYSHVFATVKDGKDSAKLATAQTKLKQLGYQTQSVKDTQKFLNQIIGVLRGIVVAFGIIAVVASIFGIINTLYISVLQRTREIGLMKALGMRKRDIGWLFRFEAAWIGFMGGVLGSLSAVLLGTLLNPIITNKLQLGAGNKLLIFKPAQIVELIIVLIVVAILAGLLPARKAANLDPINALRTE